MSRNLLVGAIGAALLVSGCKETSYGTVQVAVAAVNSNPALANPNALVWQRASPLLEGTIDPSAWRATSILSGAPDELRIELLAIAAQDGGGKWVSIWEGGAALSLTNATLDLGSALGEALRLPVGDYQALRVTVSRVGQMKGCVTGAFAFTGSAPVTTTITSGSMLGGYEPRHVGNTYTNDPIPDGSTYTFCTQAARSQLSAATFSEDAIGTNAQFAAAATPELTDVDLNGGVNEDGPQTPDEIRAASLSVDNPVAFTVSEAGEARLTLAVDLNRQLRYFANTREDFNPPNPSMKTGTSYFFTTIFPLSTMAAAGDTASIEGYELALDAGGSLIKEWMTVVRDAAGAAVTGVVIPDDDNTLTLLKGRLDPSTSARNEDGTWKLSFVIGRDGTCSLDDFAFVAADAGGSCQLTPLQGVGPLPVSYTRKL